MTTNTDPGPAATDAAMRTTDPTTLAAKAYQEGFAHAMNDKRRASALHEEVMVQVRELEARLTAAAPPSGRVCVDQVAACGEVHDIIARYMDLGDMPTRALDDMVIEIVEAVAALKGAPR